jgi:GT2 family glycosyltransferase
LLVFGTCIGYQDRYASIALPSIRRVAAPDDVILTRTGQRGIAEAYNEFIEEARGRPECAALVLMHEDVEIVDDDFRTKVLQAVQEPKVGVAGVIGGAGLRELSWWSARRTAGFVDETRGPISMGERRANVDAVDGLCLIVAPPAFRSLVFDAQNFPAFHGYDVDYCLQARSIGLRVLVIDIALFHRAKAGFGDFEAFEAARAALARKWPHAVRPDRFLPAMRRSLGSVRRTARRLAGVVRGRIPAETPADRSARRQPSDAD